MARDQAPDGPYLEAIQRGFRFAREYGRDPDPADFLVGLAAGSGAAAAAPRPGSGLSLAGIAAVSGGPARPRGGCVHLQAQEAARVPRAGSPRGADAACGGAVWSLVSRVPLASHLRG
jgi:hypothetical protein